MSDGPVALDSQTAMVPPESQAKAIEEEAEERMKKEVSTATLHTLRFYHIVQGTCYAMTGTAIARAVYLAMHALRDVRH
eukprot:883462-Rhodomonas_salina.2